MTASLLVLLFALSLAGGAIFLFVHAGRREREEDVQLRLRAMGSSADESAALSSLDMSEVRLRNPLLRAICHFLWRSGAEVEPDTVVRILLVVLLIVPVTLFLLGWFGGTSTLLIAGAFGWALLSRQAARRRSHIVEQLPQFLESVIRVLSAGNTLEESIAAAARESPEPIRPLFVSVGRQVRLGAPVESVLMETAAIHQIRDIKVMALASAINRKYGGSLRNIMRSLIQTIRQRDTAARELRALTAETRFSAMVLSIVPVTLMVYIFAQNPTYYSQMWADRSGRIMLIVSVIFQVLGVVLIYRMMRSTEDGA